MSLNLILLKKNNKSIPKQKPKPKFKIKLKKLLESKLKQKSLEPKFEPKLKSKFIPKLKHKSKPKLKLKPKLKPKSIPLSVEPKPKLKRKPIFKSKTIIKPKLINHNLIPFIKDETYKPKNKYIVSLTTIPSKFDNIHFAINSILNQNLLPEMIVINIPKVYDFRFENLTISEEKINIFLEKCPNKNIVINRIEKDYGPGTKLLGLLNMNMNIDPNTYIILVDDDLIYKPHMIKYFDIFCKNEVASYCICDNIKINLGQGADGFFIKYKTLSYFLQYYNLIKDQVNLFFHDDFYISYYFKLLNKKIFLIPYKELIYKKSIISELDALHNIKGEHGRKNLNNSCLQLLKNLNIKLI